MEQRRHNRAMRARLILLILVAALAVWSALALGEAPRARPVVTAGAISSDVGLFRAIVARVHAGDGYYTAATELQGANNYPLRPFYVVRLPTLTWVLAAIGERGGLVVLWGLLAIIAASWYSVLPAPERIAAVGLAVFAGATIISPVAVYFTEIWAGLFLSLALSLHGRPALCLVAATAALAFRELALPFPLLLFLCQVGQRRRGPAVWTLAVIMVFAATLTVHGLFVTSLVHDGAPGSQGWGSLRGPEGFVDDLRTLSFLRVLPVPIAAALAFVPLLGWHEWGRRDHFLAFGWFAGFGTVIATLARPDNFYWVAIMLPGYFIGFVFLPSFFAALAASIRSHRTQCAR
jgi:hypothetical protein